MNEVYYVIEDTEGFWLTKAPEATDTIIVGPVSLDVAERRLAREISLSGD